jgi:hypothetical protein
MSNLPAVGPGSERKLYLSLRRFWGTFEEFKADPTNWRLPKVLERCRDLAERLTNLHEGEDEDGGA